MIGLWVLVCHLVGDYLLQSDWMAQEKTKNFWVALWHAFVYTIPYVCLTQSLDTLVVICGTHALIDHFRIARYVVWIKNQLAPARYRHKLADTDWHGYLKDRPAWLAGWLFIIADNTLHLAINAAAIAWL